MKRHRPLLITTFALLASGFTDCDSQSLLQFCSQHSVQFEERFLNASLALEPWFPSHADGARMPAGTVGGAAPSVLITPVSTVGLAAMDRQAWQRWAQERLKETQLLIDRAETDPRLGPVKAELTSVANELVTFHGYSSHGNVEQMARTLDRIKLHSRKARGLACAEAAQ